MAVALNSIMRLTIFQLTISRIFGYKGELAETVKYVNWLNEIRAGLLALEFYSPEAKKWGQVGMFTINSIHTSGYRIIKQNLFFF